MQSIKTPPKTRITAGSKCLLGTGCREQKFIVAVSANSNGKLLEVQCAAEHIKSEAVRRWEQLINVSRSQQGSLYLWGVCVAFCDLKCYECFRLLLNLALNVLDLLLDLLCKLVPLKKLLGGPVVKWLSDLLLLAGRHFWEVDTDFSRGL